ncbi:MAG: hypothetical protein R6V75_02600 [Bacteroidales bacterium]
MKKIVVKTGLVLLAAILLLPACKQTGKVKDQSVNAAGQTGVVEVGIFDAVQLKDQIVGTIQSAPKPNELAEFINAGGYSYMADLTVPLDNVEKYLTAVEQSLAVGLYKFDMLYAKAFNRKDVVLQLYGVHDKLIRKLGLQQELAGLEPLDARVRANSENEDSLNVIIPEMMNKMAQSYATGEHPGIYGLSYVASNIEGLYILTQIAQMVKDNSGLIALLGQQKERVHANYMLLEMMSADESVEPLFLKMKPILDYFNNNEINSAKQLADLAPMIAGIRADILK